MKDTKKNSNQMTGQRKVRVRGACREARQVGTRRAAGMTLTVLGMSAAMTLPVSALAAEWTVQPFVSVAVGREENPTLSPGSKRKVNSTYIEPRIQLEGATETSGLLLDFATYATKYPDSDVEDADEQRLAASSFNQASERSRVGLDAELRRRILYKYVEVESGTGDLGDVDDGLARTRVRRDALVTSPFWNYALSELSTMRLEYRMRDVEFKNAAGTNLIDYKQDGVSIEYSHKVGIQDDLSLLVGSARFRPDLGEADSDALRVRLGWTHALTETAKGRILLGQNRTTEKSAAGDQDRSGFAFEVGAIQRSELTTLDAVVSRDVQPSGVGRTVESDQLRLRYRRRLSPETEFIARARTFHNEVLEGTDPNIDRRYVEFAPGFRWLVAPEWFLVAGYVFRKQKFDSDPESAKSSAVLIGMTYAPQRLGASGKPRVW